MATKMDVQQQGNTKIITYFRPGPAPRLRLIFLGDITGTTISGRCNLIIHTETTLRFLFNG